MDAQLPKKQPKQSIIHGQLIFPQFSDVSHFSQFLSHRNNFIGNSDIVYIVW